MDFVIYLSTFRGALQIISYTLQRINELYQTGELIINFDNTNIEHILPQKPDKTWNLSREDIKDYVDKIGNLTLLHKKKNSGVGNKSVKDKVHGLSTSDIGITRQIAKIIESSDYKWGEKEINQRQRDFAKLAYEKVWTV